MLRLFTGVAILTLVCAPCAALAQAAHKQVVISPATLAALSKSKATMGKPLAAPQMPVRTTSLGVRSSANTNATVVRFGPVGVREEKKRL